MFVRHIHFVVPISSSFIIAFILYIQYSIPVYGYSIIYFFILLFIVIWGACSLGLFSIQMLYLVLSGCFGRHKCSFLLCIYTGVEELGWMVGMHLALEDTAK